MVERYGPPTSKWEGHRQEASSATQRTINDKIERLRVRVRRIKAYGGSDITGVLLGILDLLGDEL